MKMKVASKALLRCIAPVLLLGGLAGGAFAAELAGEIHKLQRNQAGMGGGISTGTAKTLRFTVGAMPKSVFYGSTRNFRAGYQKIRYYPAAITDLAAATGDGFGEIVLTWTAPGADGNAGLAGDYKVAWSESPIYDDLSFEAADHYKESFVPLAAGSTETHTISGLPTGKTLYFAVKAAEPGGNLSGVSNYVSALTKEPATVDGTVSYSGTQAGRIMVAVTDSSDVVTAAILASTQAEAGGSYYLGKVQPEVQSYLVAFVDMNQSGAYDEGEDYGAYGGASPTSLLLSPGQAVTGADFSILVASTAHLGTITGETSYTGPQSGALRIEAYSDASFSGQPVAALSTAPTGSYSFVLPGDLAYYLRAYIDSNSNSSYDTGEAYGYYAPLGQGAQAIYVPVQGSVDGNHISVYDPGCSASGCAGQGSASMNISTTAAGGQPDFRISMVVGSAGMQAGAMASFGVPQGWGSLQNGAPAGLGYVSAGAITASTVTVSLDADPDTAPIDELDGQYSATAKLVTGSLSPGDTVYFALSKLSAPCLTGVGTFTVTSAEASDVEPAPLSAGSPAIEVRAGGAVSLYFTPPIATLTQYTTSQALLLTGKDLCGRTAAVASSTGVAVFARQYSFATGTFDAASDLKISSYSAGGFAAAGEIPFSAGQSTAAVYAVASATGSRHIQAAYKLDGSVRYSYSAVNVLQGNPFSGVNVSSGAFATSVLSITITPDGDGSADMAFINFTLADASLAWKVEIASVSFADGGPAVWQAMGSGSASPGRVAWDGKFTLGAQAGRPAPAGTYYVRITAGGVSNTSARIYVLANQLSGQVTDPGITPAVPVPDVKVQAYGPVAAQAVTGSDGRYSLTGLAVGTYTVTFAKSQYVTVTTTTLIASTSAALNMPLSRAPVLTVIPSLQAGATQAYEQWGGIVVFNSDWTRNLTASMRLPAGTTTFDDGGQWDVSLQKFVTRTRFRFEVPPDTYTAMAWLSGYYPSSATVYVGAAGYELYLPDITRRVSVTGGITLSTETNSNPNPSGLQVSVVAVAGDTAGGSTLVDLAPGASTGTYTIYGLEAGTYTIRAAAPGFQGVSSSPVVASLTDLTGVDLPPFGEGGSIQGTLTVDGDTTGFGSIAGSTSPISVRITAWSDVTSSHGRTYVQIAKDASSASGKYLMTGLTPGDTYYIFSEITYNSDDAFYSPGGFPKRNIHISVSSHTAVYDFSFAKASGTISGQITLPDPAQQVGAPAIDFTQASAKWTITKSRDPARVGRSYEVASSTSLPGFLCAGTTASTGTAPGCAAGVSGATFAIGGLPTETLEFVFSYAPTGFTRTLTLAVVNGSTVAAAVDARGDTYNIAGSVINQISDPLFNTNALVAANAPFSALPGYPAGISSTTARVEAIRRDFGELQTQVSTSAFDAAKTRVGFITQTGTYTITGLQNGVYLVRTLPLRAYATGPVLVPAVEQVVTITNSSKTGVNFTLADGFSVSGSAALEDGLSDARSLRLTLRNTRGETVDTQDLLLGNPGAGVPASSADFLFERVPGGSFYTLSLEDLDSPVKYVSRVLFFPDRTSSPDGLQGDETGLELPLKQAGFITGRLRDANSGELITGENASLLASNFYIYAVANPWVDGGYAVAQSSISGRPIEADGTFRIGPLPPAASYDVHFRQRSWDIAYLSAGSQNYAPARSAQNYLTSGEVKDIGIIGLNQGQSITGVVSDADGIGLPNISMTAVPALTDSVAAVETQTDADGSYTLWVSTYISRWFDLTAAAREDNLAASGGTLYGKQTLRVDLNSSTSAYFTLSPLLGAVTGQVLTGDGGALSYPFGGQKGYPAAAVYMQPENTIPENDWLGDITAMTDTDGSFEVPGLSTGVYTLNVVSLGYVVNTSSITVTTGTVSAGDITLSRAASVIGSLRKSDPDSPTGYSCPNDQEVAGVAAADESFGEFLTGTVETDPSAHTVCAYEITGFVPGLNYHIALLGPTGAGIDFPPEGAVSFGLQESTATKLANLTYRAPAPGCVPTFKYLGTGQVQLKFGCNRALRNETGLDNDLDYILDISTYAADGTPFTYPNGGGEFLGADKRLQDGRRNLTAVYRPAASEERFTVRLRAYTAELDPSTGANYLIDELHDFYTAVDASRSRSISNIHGGKLEIEAEEDEDLVENTSVALQPGAFMVDGSTYAAPGTSVQVGINKGRTREQVEVQSFVPGAVTPQDAARIRSLGSYPDSMAEAIKAIRDVRVAGYTPSAAGGGNDVSPFSAFYDIFLPAGIRRELREKARLTLTYDASLSSASPMNLNIWYYNSSTQRYELESDGKEIDTVNHTVSALVDHFSTFVVLSSTPIYTSTSPYNGGEIEVFNFPNPFNLEPKTKSLNLNAGGGSFSSGAVQVTTRGTVIRVGVPRSVSGNGSLRVYTLAGELVREYDCGWLDGSAGPSGSGTYYYFEWDGRNSEGSDVASDVYFGEMKIGGEHKFWKMAVVKDSRYR